MDYLRNFITADPDYDWYELLAPSTPGYMLKFQIDNAEVIAAAKEELWLNTEAEKKIMVVEEARKKEMAGGENSEVASPSHTAAT